MAKYQPCLQPIYREILVAIENPTNFLVNANIGPCHCLEYKRDEGTRAEYLFNVQSLP